MSTRNLKLLAPLMLVLFLSGAAMPEGGADMLETNTLTSEDSAEALATVVDTVQKSAAAITGNKHIRARRQRGGIENGDSIQESEAAVPETEEPYRKAARRRQVPIRQRPKPIRPDRNGYRQQLRHLASFLDYFVSPELESVMEVLGLDSLDPAVIESLRIETVFESVKDAVRSGISGHLRAMAAALSGSMVISAVGAISPGKSTLDRLLSVAAYCISPQWRSIRYKRPSGPPRK
jgi:hypothetical protein